MTFGSGDEHKMQLELDPRLNLTKPIYEQFERFRAGDAADESAAAMLSAIEPHFTADDEPGAWKLTLRTVLLDIATQDSMESLPEKQFVRIGCCSHWFRPHQSRWTAAGGFAWPSGWHGVSGWSRRGLPEFDWDVLFEKVGLAWEPVMKFSGKQRLEVRVSVPARTARHAQAAIHTLWTPMNHRVLYGMRKRDDQWKLAARSDFYGEDEDQKA